MRGDRFLFTAFAIGYLGPWRAMWYALAGVLVGFMFWVLLWVAMYTDSHPVKPVDERTQAYHQLQHDMKDKFYLCALNPRDPRCPK